MSFLLPKTRIDHLSPVLNFAIDVLRLDEIDPIISGNKWFKLQRYLEDAAQNKKTTLLTFGGAYSNHIIATAAAGKQQGFQSIGVIRGERPKNLSHTLIAAESQGMMLYFISREEYREKRIPADLFKQYNAAEIYAIPEGGYGTKGAEGAGNILLQTDTSSYTHIITAVGTGTTLAGLINAARDRQKLVGIPVLKNADSLRNEIKNLLHPSNKSSFELWEDYHFGGYAKYAKELLQFMNEFYQLTNIPTDFVYTAKAFFAVVDMLKKNYFSPTDSILLIHTGGLQGNLSLPKGTLIFGQEK